MKKILLLAILLTPLMTVCAATPGEPAIIPVPEHIERGEGVFNLTPATRIYVDSASRETGEYLAGYLRKSTGYPFKISTASAAESSEKGAILLTTQKANRGLGAEGYELSASRAAVVIRAPEQAGVFYGVQSLLQLLPPEIFSCEAGGQRGMADSCRRNYRLTPVQMARIDAGREPAFLHQIGGGADCLT